MSASYKTMWVGGLAGLVAWVEAINWLGLIGALVAIGGFLVNLYFQAQRNKREKAQDMRDQLEHEARMVALADRAPRRQGDISPALEKVADNADA